MIDCRGMVVNKYSNGDTFLTFLYKRARDIMNCQETS
jgi:hypothetical protein